MTDFAKWDRIVFEMSDSDDEAAATATAAAERAPRAVPRPVVANGMGNALGHNADVADVEAVRLSEVAWRDLGDTVEITLPLGDAARNSVACSFGARSIELRLGAPPTQQRVLRVKRLHARVAPERCEFAVASKGTADFHSEGIVRVTLVKVDAGGAAWKSLEATGPDALQVSARERARGAPPLTISSYSWLDLTQGVRVFLNVPEIDSIPLGDITVNFRDKSFDVEVLDIARAKRWVLAVTELPDTVIIGQCKWKVKDGQLSVYLRKWARMGWSKLQMKRG